MTPDLSLLSGFARGVLLSLHVRDTDTCLHSGSWLLSGCFSNLHLYLSGTRTGLVPVNAPDYVAGPLIRKPAPKAQ